MFNHNPSLPKFEPVREANLYGYQATRPDGSLRVEVLRAYAGEWLVFSYGPSETLRTSEGETKQRGKPFHAAMAQARRLLKPVGNCVECGLLESAHGKGLAGQRFIKHAFKEGK